MKAANLTGVRRGGGTRTSAFTVVCVTVWCGVEGIAFTPSNGGARETVGAKLGNDAGKAVGTDFYIVRHTSQFFGGLAAKLGDVFLAFFLKLGPPEPGELIVSNATGGDADDYDSERYKCEVKLHENPSVF